MHGGIGQSASVAQLPKRKRRTFAPGVSMIALQSDHAKEIFFTLARRIVAPIAPKKRRESEKTAHGNLPGSFRNQNNYGTILPRIR
jgi:hypothetical protein